MLFRSEHLDIHNCDNMGDRKQTSKCTAQKLNNSNQNSPSKTDRTKILKPNDTKQDMEEENYLDVKGMFEIIIKKLSKLDTIDSRIETIEKDLNEVKSSLEFVHTEVQDLKEEIKISKKTEAETKQRLEKLEQMNSTLNNRVIDLQARSMRDNLIFYNLKESKDENTTEVVHSLIESHFGIEDAKSIRIDRSHRMGKQRGSKPWAIVAKFNYYPDKARLLASARKLKGTGIAVSEQVPEEIVAIRKSLYPEMKKGRDAGKKCKLVRDKLYI